jgi:hypothetical protein
MLRYIINVLVIVVSFNGYSQAKDSITHTSPYGLRLGIDISKPILGMLDSNSSGIEFVADYRISENWYVAAEFGNQKERTIEDYTTSTSKGNFIKAGFNYNAYQNWLNMNNEIYVGLRYATSIYKQTLDSYTINTGSDYFVSNATAPATTTDLNAHWAEFVMGIKVETFKNLYIGLSFNYKIMLNLKHPTNFKTLYVPGFNRVFETETGFGFNYTLSYTIPFMKK